MIVQYSLPCTAHTTPTRSCETAIAGASWAVSAGSLETLGATELKGLRSGACSIGGSSELKALPSEVVSLEVACDFFAVGVNALKSRSKYEGAAPFSEVQRRSVNFHPSCRYPNRSPVGENHKLESRALCCRGDSVAVRRVFSPHLLMLHHARNPVRRRLATRSNKDADKFRRWGRIGSFSVYRRRRCPEAYGSRWVERDTRTAPL